MAKNNADSSESINSPQGSDIDRLLQEIEAERSGESEDQSLRDSDRLTQGDRGQSCRVGKSYTSQPDELRNIFQCLNPN